MADYVAFLRGINVGGHRPVPMQGLKKAFESLQFKNVRTLLASGNVLFEAPRADTVAREMKIEVQLMKTFRHEIGVFIRTMEDLQRLSASRPFSGIPVTPQTRLYVTFLSEKLGKDLQIPYESPGGNFKILRASEREVWSVVTILPNSRSVDLMQVLEKKFGQRITTRNWQTILRVLKAHQE
jgi:uncharacterized protein (DUF1697 family)